MNLLAMLRNGALEQAGGRRALGDGAFSREDDIIRRLVADGYFDKAAAGDHLACGRFVRLVAYTLNPTGDRAGWGWLRKTGGGANVEGYSEDAMVLGDDPTNLNNVVDIIGGAGAPGATAGMGAFVNRRTSDVWERPRPLTEAELSYLKPGSTGGGGGETPTPACKWQPIAAGPLIAKMDSIEARMGGVEDAATSAEAAAVETRAMVQELITVLRENGLQLDASARFIGNVRGTAKLPTRG